MVNTNGNTARGPMKIDVLTLFPHMFTGPLDESIVQRARTNGLLQLNIHNLRTYTHDIHQTVDDRPFGGGPGMLLKPEPLFEALEDLAEDDTHIIFLTPSGRKFNQAIARELSTRNSHLILVCGSYEGFDQRILQVWADDERSIGDYVLTNGALPAMVLIDVVTRLLPGALGKDQSTAEESFSTNALEYPQYTRPAVFRGMEVPEILLSGHHARIAQWRSEQSILKTAAVRPDLLEKERTAHTVPKQN